MCDAVSIFHILKWIPSDQLFQPCSFAKPWDKAWPRSSRLFGNASLCTWNVAKDASHHQDYCISGGSLYTISAATGRGYNPRQKHVHHLPYGIMVSFLTDSTTLPQEKNWCNLPSCTSPSSATRWNTWVATNFWELHRTFPDTPSKHSKHIQTWRCHM